MQRIGGYVVFVDANVFYSRTLRDWLGLLYTMPDESPFVVRWSEDVMAEVVHSLRRKHPSWDGSRITAIHDRLCDTFEAGRVTDYRPDGTYQGRDPHDAHVHAATVACARTPWSPATHATLTGTRIPRPMK